MTTGIALAVLAGTMLALLVMPPYALAIGAVAGLYAVAGLIAILMGSCAPTRRVLAVTVAFAAAILHCGLVVVHERAQRWPVARDGDRVLVDARIVSIPAWREQGLQFDVETEPSARFDIGRIRVRVQGAALGRTPHAGEHWQLMLQLRVPHAPLNAGSPDMERQWFRERIHALGKVVRSDLNVRRSTARPGIDPLRERIARAFGERVPDRDAAALFAALAVGVTGEVSRSQWRVFNATGITHLVAISGLHVTLFATIAMFTARRVWRWCPGRSRVSRDDFAACAGIAASLGYTLLAGFSVPAQRTLIMLTAWIIAARAARAHSELHAFATALVLVIALDPLAPLSSGFWLSFVAVLTIIVALGSRLAGEGVVRAMLRTQVIVTFALLPITFAWFGSVSVASLVVNLAAIPVFTLLLVPLVLAATAALFVAPVVADLALGIALGVLDIAWPALQAAAAWPFALFVREPPLAWYALALVACVVAIMPWPAAFRVTSAAALLPLFGTVSARDAPVIVVTALDAGQGPSVMIQARESVVLHGVPEQFRSEGARSARLVVPALQARAIRRIDHVILPRMTRDHAAGLAELLLAMKIRDVHVGTEWPGAVLAHSTCAATPAWTAADVSFELLPVGACTLRVVAPAGSVMIVSRARLAAALDHLQRAGSAADVIAIDYLRPGDAMLAARMSALGVRRVLEMASPRDAGPRAARMRSSDVIDLRRHGIALDSVWREAGTVELSLDDHGFSRERPSRERLRWPWRMGPV